MRKSSEANKWAALAANRIISKIIQDHRGEQIKQVSDTLHEMVTAMVATCWNLIPEAKEHVCRTTSSTILAGVGSDLYGDCSINLHTNVEVYDLIKEYEEKSREESRKKFEERKAAAKARYQARIAAEAS